MLSRAGSFRPAEPNGDGQDIVVGDEKRGLFLFRGLGKPSFTQAKPLGSSGAAPYSIGLAGMNRDGLVDIVVASRTLLAPLSSPAPALRSNSIRLLGAAARVRSTASHSAISTGTVLDIAAARSDARVVQRASFFRASPVTR